MYSFDFRRLWQRKNTAELVSRRTEEVDGAIPPTDQNFHLKRQQRRAIASEGLLFT